MGWYQTCRDSLYRLFWSGGQLIPVLVASPSHCRPLYQLGTKFDSVPMNGPQGIGKSLSRKAGGEWFSDGLTLTDMRDNRV